MQTIYKSLINEGYDNMKILCAYRFYSKLEKLSFEEML